LVRQLLALLVLLFALPALAAPVVYAPVRPGVPLIFPRDHGAHPAFRTEWWYLTGWLQGPDGKPLGFQITFFRTRPGVADDHPSRFAAKQVIFAHAALSDPANGRLLHDQRIARAGFGLAGAALDDMAVNVDGWELVRLPDRRLVARIAARDFSYDLVFTPTQPVLPQGRGGFSRKGPGVGEASHYYSWPHLQVRGRLVRGGKAMAVQGTAWLDREWSSTLLNKQAVGWDWLGLNMDDGGAITLFRVRDAAGRALWAGGSHRDAKGRVHVLAPGDVRWQPGTLWASPRTGARYPVAPVVHVRLPGGVRQVVVTPLMNDQELDSRAGGGPVYWEGAVRVPGGRGYLEMTGYASRLAM
jgi:predicted secreted hydrolase